MDFTRSKYIELLNQLQESRYGFVTYAGYLADRRPERFVILRHDVDLRPVNALRFAEIEAKIGARATYYFRAVAESWDDEIIRTIHRLGHEVGYHYESLTTQNGDVEHAYDDFRMNLERLRRLVPVESICMHGSPRSPYDSKDIWKHYEYESLGILGEPYLTTDFSKMLYLTDTGRRWDGYKVSVRDKIEGFQDEWNRKGWTFHGTDEIISALRRNILPDELMITTHPQRWFDPGPDWVKELIVQNAKNVVKGMIVSRKGK